MAIPNPTVPTAITNLISQVNTQVAADTGNPLDQSKVLVVQGEEGKEHPHDIINVGVDVKRTVTWRTLIGSAQAQAWEEDYEIECRVSSWGGIDPGPVVNRAWVLQGYLETAVRTDPSLGGVVQEASIATSGGGNAAWSGSPISRVCEITSAVRCVVLN